MNPTWTTLLFTFAGTAVLAGTAFSMIYESYFRYPASVRERVNELCGKVGSEKHSLLLDIKQLAESASKAPNNWQTSVRDLLEQSGLRVTARTVVTISIGIGVVAATGIFLATHRIWTAPLGMLAGMAAPWIFVCVKRRSRLRRLLLQLPDALDVICRAVRAGQTVPATFQMVADDFPRPICEEFRYCYEQQNLGISYDVALRNLARGTGIMELRILVVALLVQSRSGGNLTELLQNLATMIRKRLALQQRVRALTGEGRMQAAVLIALPAVVFVATYLLNREYAQVLIDRPWLLAGCAASQAIGAYFIRKLIKIEY